MSAFELQGSSSDGAERSIDGSMAAGAINWRPLGELFLEHGLITRDELEEALSVQAETKERLGQVLVTKGLVSRPELLKVLVDQLGLELEHEGEPTMSQSVVRPAVWRPSRRPGSRRRMTDLPTIHSRSRRRVLPSKLR